MNNSISTLEFKVLRTLEKLSGGSTELGFYTDKIAHESRIPKDYVLAALRVLRARKFVILSNLYCEDTGAPHGCGWIIVP